MPFAGDAAAARAAVASLSALGAGPGDELILADNSGGVDAAVAVRVVRAAGEGSPSHARNTGATAATRDWVLFLDADTVAPPDLIDRFFAAAPIADDVGAVAGEV